MNALARTLALPSLLGLIGLVAGVACEPAREPARTPLSDLPPVVGVELPSFDVPSLPNRVDAGAAQPAGWLPPPRPSVIPLATTGDASLDAKLAEGDAAMAKEDFATAIRVYGDAKRAAPKHPAPIVGFARATIAKETPTLNFAAARGNRSVQMAIGELKRAAKMDPEYGPADAELGRAYLLLGEGPAAIDPLRRASSRLPNEPEVHSALGVALLASGKGEEAVGSLSRAVELDPGSAPRRGNLGTALFMRGRVDAAVKEYEVQVRIEPNDPRARSDLGTALLARNDFAGAMRELTKAIELDPTRATFRSNLGYALQLQGKRDEAIASYREALKLDDKNASAWINLATALAKEPSTRGEARAALEKARALDPTDPRVAANLKELDAVEREAKDAGAPKAP